MEYQIGFMKVNKGARELEMGENSEKRAIIKEWVEKCEQHHNTIVLVFSANFIFQFEANFDDPS